MKLRGTIRRVDTRITDGYVFENAVSCFGFGISTRDQWEPNVDKHTYIILS